MHRLYTALTYVYNRIQEYRRPLVVLLSAIILPTPGSQGTGTTAGDSSSGTGTGADRHRGIGGGGGAGDDEDSGRLAAATASAAAALTACHKLLVYIRCTFHGVSFPPGSGPANASSSSPLSVSFGGDTSIASHPPPPPLDPSNEPRAQLLGSLLFMEAADLEREWGVGPGWLRSQAGIQGPYPALQVGLGVAPGVGGWVQT